MKFIIHATNKSWVIPDEIDSFFKDGCFFNEEMNRRWEADAYHLYLALGAYETISGISQDINKRKVIDALLKGCENGFWMHPGWSDWPRETHLRITSLSIRTLIRAYQDGLVEDASFIVELLKKHVSFRQELQGGVFWFLHDSLEKNPSVTSRYHDNQLLPVMRWGSFLRNGLVLNSHTDTCVTVLDALMHLDMGCEDERYFKSLLKPALHGLEKLLLEKKNGGFFSWVDRVARSMFLPMHGWEGLPGKVRARLQYMYFSLRWRIAPTHFYFQFKDGYIQRSLNLKGPDYDYLVVDAWDSLRLADVLDQWDPENVIAGELRRSGVAALEYIAGTNYSKLIHASFKKSGFPILFCEAVLLLIRCNCNVPGKVMSFYFQIRRHVPPTPCLVGYDPLLFGENSLSRTLLQNMENVSSDLLLDGCQDIMVTSGSEYVIIDVLRQEVSQYKMR